KWGILSIDMQTAVTEDEAEPRERKDVTDDESIPDIIDAPVTPSDTLEAGSVVQGSMI
ncbi:recombinase RecT, partial [Listeria monocytogenes]|nr:recombinase RecT [Listeria monocytogenes]